jgi:hypothetical protein
MLSASKRWRLLNGSDLLPDVIAGVQFTDGVTPPSPRREGARILFVGFDHHRATGGLVLMTGMFRIQLR